MPFVQQVRPPNAWLVGDFPTWLTYQDGTDSPELTDWLMLIGCVVSGPLSLLVSNYYQGKSRNRSRRTPPPPSEADTSVSAPDSGGMDAPLATTDVSSRAGGKNGDSEERSGTATGGEAGHAAQVAEPSEAPRERVVYYDFFRTLCVCLVCETHASDRAVNWNVAGCQMWVLPLITMISGALYAKSRMPLHGYSARLLLYFSVGCTFNGIACLVRGVRWYGGEFNLIIMFQMAFVLLFIGGAMVGRALKGQFGPEATPAIARRNIVCYSLVVGILVVAQIILAVASIGGAGVEQVLRLSTYCIMTAWIAAVGLHFLPQSHKGLLGWIMLLWIYGTRVAHKEDRPGLEFHLVDLYIWAFVVQLAPLAGQAVIGEQMARWWPAWAISIALIMVPGQHGRMDQYPFPNMAMRLCSQYWPEFLVVVAFTTIPCGKTGRNSFPDWAADHMAWLNTWCLFAYLCHWATYLLVGMPYPGCLLIFSTMGVFYFWKYKPSRASSSRPCEAAEV